MELKLAEAREACPAAIGLNCTFMELKLKSALTKLDSEKVLIVPLWN